MSNVGEGILHGFLSLLGVGSAVDPVGDASQAASAARKNMEDMINMSVYQTLAAQQDVQRDLKLYIDANQVGIIATMEDLNSMTQVGLERTNYFLYLTIILVFTLVTFYLIS